MQCNAGAQALFPTARGAVAGPGLPVLLVRYAPCCPCTRASRRPLGPALPRAALRCLASVLPARARAAGPRPVPLALAPRCPCDPRPTTLPRMARPHPPGIA